MNTRDIQTLFAYNGWANERVMSDSRSLTRDELTQDLGTSHSSVQGTLVHILWGEWLWMRRFQGHSPKEVFVPAEFSELPVLGAKWKEVEREQEKFISQLTDEALASRVAYENLQGQRWEYSLGHMMQHVVNHSSYHRGQVVTLLRQLGRAPQPTDFLMFFDERGGQGAG
ncbi:MAG TPA: DinB family protein [Thermoanaerobaculia bacterium]|nr:DinB family protein [Thermoanaerobaculia bacterium]